MNMWEADNDMNINDLTWYDEAPTLALALHEDLPSIFVDEVDLIAEMYFLLTPQEKLDFKRKISE